MFKATSKNVVDEYTHHKTAKPAKSKPLNPFKLKNIDTAANPKVGNMQYPNILIVRKKVICCTSAIKLNKLLNPNDPNTPNPKT
jgi:hypothetical protein|tara:strand:+ start:103 stop:354 length:252 start_codon:yes stop_codon:yes gene_type:complete